MRLELPAELLTNNTNYRRVGAALFYFHHHADTAGVDLNQTPHRINRLYLETKSTDPVGDQGIPGHALQYVQSLIDRVSGAIGSIAQQGSVESATATMRDIHE